MSGVGKAVPEERNGVGTESEGTKRGCGVVGSKNGGEWTLWTLSKKS